MSIFFSNLKINRLNVLTLVLLVTLGVCSWELIKLRKCNLDLSNTILKRKKIEKLKLDLGFTQKTITKIEEEISKKYLIYQVKNQLPAYSQNDTLSLKIKKSEKVDSIELIVPKELLVLRNNRFFFINSSRRN